MLIFLFSAIKDKLCLFNTRKMKKYWFFVVGSLCMTLMVFPSWKASAPQAFTLSSKVNDVLFALGQPKPSWYPEDLSEAAIERGREMIFNGRTTAPDGSKSKFISVYYMCTNCHNTVIEDPILSVADPQARLEYAAQHDIPFLQGTTFYGITNRETWYNDDYYKKYGDLVKPANENLAEAVQLCAMECSQGRPVEDWEIQSIIAYYTTIGYSLSDIGFSEQDLSALNADIASGKNTVKWVENIRGRYLHKSPATFLEPPYDNYWETLRGKGDAANGKLVYELSCQACHKSYGVSDVVFGDDKQEFKQFNRWFKKNDWWLFQVVRHGTHPAPGHREYMPHYTKERMTDQQVEDLRAYILERAGKGS